MRISIATGPLFPVPAIAGGAIPRMWLALAREFAQQGHEVEIVARSFPNQVPTEIIDGVRIARFGGFDQSRSIVLDLSRDLFYSLATVFHLGKADILVTNDFWLPLVASRWRRRAGLIVVNANRYPKGQFRLYRKASLIAAASTVVADAVVRECPELMDRTRVVPNPIDTSVFRPSEATVDGLRKCVLFVGRLHPEKGVHTLIEAFSRFLNSFPDWRLLLVGPCAEGQGGGGPTYEKRLRVLTRDLPVEIVGPIFDPVELARYLQSATIFCYPSFADRGEALPVAPLEAMACGAPILTSRLECFRDYLVEGETGFTFDHEATDPVQSLADKLNTLALQPELLARVGSNAAMRAREFGVRKVANAFLSEFTRLIEGRS